MRWTQIAALTITVVFGALMAPGALAQRFRPGGGGPGGFDPAVIAKNSFPKIDKNKDNKISKEEAAESDAKSKGWSKLAAEFETHDKNKDGYLDLEEYTEYLKGRFAPKGGDKSAATTASTTPAKPSASSRSPEPPDEGAIVYRYGKMPKGLPSWFEEYDKDKDGQVALHEWISVGKKSVAEFRKHDLNKDGLITAEELLSNQRAVERAATLAKALESGELASLLAPSTPSTSSSKPEGGREGKKKFGKKKRGG